MNRLGSCLVVAALWTTSAHAEVTDASRAAARELGYAGVESYQAGNYQVAYDKLDKAYQVLDVPSLGLWSARALIKLNRWVEAAERLRQVLRLAPQGGEADVQQQSLHDAKRELEALTPRIPSLVIQVEGSPSGGAQVTLDGDIVAAALLGEPLPTNPGRHAVVVQFGSRSIMREAARSLTEPPGFMNSALRRMVQPVSAEARSSLISGVWPMASMIPLRTRIPEFRLRK